MGADSEVTSNHHITQYDMYTLTHLRFLDKCEDTS